MKIVAGKYGGRRLIEPKGRDIRPTSDKVRGAIFNMLVSRGAIEGAQVLDAFCGTGALGLEALSRGAKSCHFVDKSRTSLSLARENAEVFGVSDCATYTRGDARKIILSGKNYESGQRRSETHDPNLEISIKGTEAYSLVFLDPPYCKNLINDVLWVLKDAEHLYDDAWIVCESEKEFLLDDIEGFRIDSGKEYGTTKIVLLQYEGTYGG